MKKVSFFLWILLSGLGVSLSLPFGSLVGGLAWAQAPLRANQPYAEAAKCADPNVIFCEDFNYPGNFSFVPTAGTSYGTATWINPASVLQSSDFTYGAEGRRINPASSYSAKPGGNLASGNQTDHVWVANWDSTKGSVGNATSWAILRNAGGNYVNGQAPLTDFYIRFQFYVTQNYVFPGEPKPDPYNFGTPWPVVDNKILFFYPVGGQTSPTGASYDAGFVNTMSYVGSQNARYTDSLLVRVGNASDNYKMFPNCWYCSSNPTHTEYTFQNPTVLSNPHDTPVAWNGSSGKLFRFDRNKWYTLEMRYKLSNPSGAKNGVVEVWVDGTKIYSASDLETCAQAEVGDCSGLGAIDIVAYHNGADKTVWNGQQVIDNLIVSRSYIGPPDGGSVAVNPPATPGGLVVR
jgi:hypothetical protein